MGLFFVMIPIVAIQGGEGSFHEAAAQRYFSNEINFEPCETFGGLIAEVKSGRCSSGVMAIENSVAGSILPNYARIQESGLVIIGEIYLKIHQHLMALPGETMGTITEVNSHPMAILQCEKFFENHPHMRLVEKPDTALSAKDIFNRKLTGRAAIASEGAASLYGLNILAREIETNKRNYTRFLVIEKSSAQAKLSQGKASICFRGSHKPGSLALLLQMMGSHELNLTKIQSLPAIGEEWSYLFHCDIEFNDRNALDLAITEMKKETLSLDILGIYPRGQHELSV